MCRLQAVLFGAEAGVIWAAAQLLEISTPYI